MFLTGPAVVREVMGEDVDAFELGGHKVHERNGVAHFVAADDNDAALLVRDLLDHLPSHTRRARAALAPGRPARLRRRRAGAGLRPLGLRRPRRRARHPRRRPAARVRRRKWARNIVCGFGRARRPRRSAWSPTSPSTWAACSTPSRRSKARALRAHLQRVRAAARRARRHARLPARHRAGGAPASSATAPSSCTRSPRPRVPKVTVVLRKAFGGAFIAMNARDLGADYVFAWPQAQLGVMGAKQAVTIVNRRDIAAADDPDAARDELRRRLRRRAPLAEHRRRRGLRRRGDPARRHPPAPLRGAGHPRRHRAAGARSAEHPALERRVMTRYATEILERRRAPVASPGGDRFGGFRPAARRRPLSRGTRGRGRSRSTDPFAAPRRGARRSPRRRRPEQDTEAFALLSAAARLGPLDLRTGRRCAGSAMSSFRRPVAARRPAARRGPRRGACRPGGEDAGQVTLVWSLVSPTGRPACVCRARVELDRGAREESASPRSPCKPVARQEAPHHRRHQPRVDRVRGRAPGAGAWRRGRAHRLRPRQAA